MQIGWPKTGRILPKQRNIWSSGLANEWALWIRICTTEACSTRFGGPGEGNHTSKSEASIQSETALNAGDRGAFDGSVGSNTSKRTQRCTMLLDTRTSSIRILFSIKKEKNCANVGQTPIMTLVVDSTPHTTLSLAQRTCLIMCCTTHWLKCLVECVSCHLHGHPRCAVVRSLTLCSLPCSSPCVSPISSSSSNLNPDLYLFFHVVVIGAKNQWHSAQWGIWPLGRKRLSQDTSPTSLTTSTSRKPLKSSSGTNPATRCPRTCLTRNSTTRPSAERSLYHCSFRSEKNQRTKDKLITLLTKVCCQLSPFLSVM